jgi:NAD-dependent dihydropyrimidine dehydrogenase PreA subunit
MRIDQEECSGCKMCTKVCTVGAISMNEDKKAQIDLDQCVECGVCKRIEICPTDAIVEEELSWPRSIRRLYSDPTGVFVETGVDGRGTEEMKTNEITSRYLPGELGVILDVGRPNVGTTFKDIEIIASALAKDGIEFEKSNPIIGLMEDPQKGKFRSDIKNERVLSAILEFTVPVSKILRTLDQLKKVGEKIDTVFSVGIISVTQDNQAEKCLGQLIQNGWNVKPNGKVNLGLGRPD